MYARKKSISMKVIALLLAMVLLVGVAIGGTIAWLMDTTETVTNTFTVGDIDIELKEYDLTSTEVTSGNTYKIVPGKTQPKQPFVRFVDNSEPCWLFVEIYEKNNTISGKDYKYVTYSVDSSWSALDATNHPGVYYRELTSTILTNTTYDILADNQVSYNQNLTKQNLDAVVDNMPELIFTAYAVQREAANTAADAWALAKTTT